MTLSFLVSRRELVLGAQDPITGWYAKSYTLSTGLCPVHGIVDNCYDYCVIAPKGFNLSRFGIGSYAKYTTTGIICAPLFEGDEIIAGGKYYEVASVEDIDFADSHMWYVCELHELQMHWDMPGYGANVGVDDPRERTKVWLDTPATGIAAANLLEYDGVTQASYITCWSGAPYNIKRVFQDKGIDVIFSIDRIQSKPVIGHNKKAFQYEETLPIDVCAVDKTTINGNSLSWQGERELRRIGEANPVGLSVRGFSSMALEPKQLGSLTLYTVRCILDYTRDPT